MTGSRSSTGMASRRAARGAAFLLGVSMALSLGAGVALADKVGVAAAVNPDAFSSLSSTPNKQLNIGKSIFYNERINTTNSGLVQVLLIDGSTFTVGPNSDLVIDRFVYNPQKKTGELVATFSKGTMRFIGGKLSKNEGGVTVKTPAGALAIRGGMVQGSVKGYSALFSFLFGDHMTFTGNDGQSHTVYQTGYTLDLSGGTPSIRPTTPQDTNTLMQALSTGGGSRGTGSYDNTGGNTGPNGSFQTANNVESDASQLINDANIVMIQTEILSQLNKQNNTTPNTPTNETPNKTSPVDESPSIQTTYGGYGTGIIRSDEPQKNFVNIVSSTEPTDLLASSAEARSGVITFRDVQDGDGATSAYILGANLISPGPTQGLVAPSLSTEDYFKIIASVLDQTGNPYSRVSATGFAVDGDEFGLTGLFPETFGAPQDGKPAPFCKGCDFLRWGAVAARVAFSNAEDSTQYIDSIHNGWWVAGELPTVGDLPLTGNANYEGHTIGTVLTRPEPGGAWTERLAAGDIHMDWDFGKRSGNLNIIDFDQGKLSLSGKMSMPGQLSSINKFSGPLSAVGENDIPGSAITGSAVGSFAKRGADPAGGVIGNWNAANQVYKATGIFGAGRKP